VPTNKASQADEVTGSSPASTFEGFLGFSYGPRTCLGHKFAKVESVVFLTMVLRERKVVVELDGMSKDEWRRKYLEPKFGQALLLGEMPLKPVRRT
jgi:cytochrome P450